MASEEIKSILDYGLKVKLFIIDCSPQCLCDYVGFVEDILNDCKSHFDYIATDMRTTLKTIAKSKFINYSTIVIILNGGDFDNCNRILQVLLNCLRKNQFLRYKAKLIVVNQIATSASILKRSSAADNLDFEFESDYNKYDNVVILLNKMENKIEAFKWYIVMFHIMRDVPLWPIQKTLELMRLPENSRAVRSSTNVDVYFYTINPALAIIVNNYYFTASEGFTPREGSEQDVSNIIRTLKLLGLPYIIVEDCSRQQLLKLFDYLATANFSPVKTFLLFLMSHGDSDNVLYTYDGQLDINRDIVERLQSNASLKEASKLILVNACRGDIDLDYATKAELKQIKPTVNHNHLLPNTMILYSVPDRVQSPRCPQAGSPIVQSLCSHLLNIDHTDDVEKLEREIDHDLEFVDYYCNHSLRFELLRHGNEKHHIISIPLEAVQMLTLLQRISRDFPIGDTSVDCHKVFRGLHYICGSLNEISFPKWVFIRKYFGPELESDRYRGNPKQYFKSV